MCMFVRGRPDRIPSATRWNLTDRSLTALPPVLSPNIFLPPPSSHHCFIRARKSSVRALKKIYYFNFSLLRCILISAKRRLLRSPCPSFCPSACISAVAPWTDIRANWYLGIFFMKICQETPRFVKIGQKRWDTLHEDLNRFYSLRRHKFATENCAKLSIFISLTVTIVAFPLQQWLTRTRYNVRLYVHCLA